MGRVHGDGVTGVSEEHWEGKWDKAAEVDRDTVRTLKEGSLEVQILEEKPATRTEEAEEEIPVVEGMVGEGHADKNLEGLADLEDGLQEQGRHGGQAGHRGSDKPAVLHMVVDHMAEVVPAGRSSHTVAVVEGDSWLHIPADDTADAVAVEEEGEEQKEGILVEGHTDSSALEGAHHTG